MLHPSPSTPPQRGSKLAPSTAWRRTRQSNSDSCLELDARTRNRTLRSITNVEAPITAIPTKPNQSDTVK